MAKFVIFSENGARIYKNPNPILLLGAEYIENPDLSAVKGLPPHRWALEDGRVVPAPFIKPEPVIEAPTLPIVEVAPIPEKRLKINLKPLLYIALGALAHWLLS